MANLKLKLACNGYDRCRALFDRRVQPDGIDLELECLKPRELFPRMLDSLEFDVSELSLGSYAALVARDRSPFVAIPVPLSKTFRHSCIYIRKGAGIERPQDLKGRRVGTTQYGATAIVTIKGMLQDEYGLEPQDLRWFVGGLNAPTEAPLIPLNLPAGVELEFLGPGRTLEAMFAKGELDALFSIYFPKLFLEASPVIARLFPNYREVEQDYYRRMGIFPVMHVVVIRKSLYRDEPWIAQSLYTAFCRARDLAVEPLYDTDALMVALPWLIDHVEETRRMMGRDYWAYGIEPNRPAFAALARWIYDQGFAPRLVTPDELFVPVREDFAAP
jgi:4,5-dihydroxyphthalate decarboxylase